MSREGVKYTVAIRYLGQLTIVFFYYSLHEYLDMATIHFLSVNSNKYSTAANAIATRKQYLVELLHAVTLKYSLKERKTRQEKKVDLGG